MRRGSVVVGVVAGLLAASPAAADPAPNGGTIVLTAIGNQIADNLGNIVAAVVMVVSGAGLVLAGVMQAQEWERKWLASLSPRDRAWAIHRLDARDRRRRRRR